MSRTSRWRTHAAIPEIHDKDTCLFTLFMTRILVTKRKELVMSLMKLPPWAYLLLALAPVPIMFLPIFDSLPSAVGKSVGIAVLFWCLTMSWLHWRNLDEPARVAHKSSWYCGGAAGLGAAVILSTAVIFWPEANSALVAMVSEPKHGSPESQAFFFGVVFAAIVQLAGTLAAWLLWWSRRS
ncbi:MAG: hypothetical protein R3C52_01875 [Hyphomonadaceae bacterium]